MVPSPARFGFPSRPRADYYEAAWGWTLPDQSPVTPPHREPTSDDFLQALLTGDFSSPSLLPQNPRSPDVFRPDLADASQPVTDVSQPASASAQPRGIKREDDSETNLRDLDAMPAARKRTAAASRAETGPSTKRARTSRAAKARPTTSTKRLPSKTAPSRQDVFGTSDNENEEAKPSAETDELDLTTMGNDFVNAETKPDNSIKLSSFQCVICMDDVTNLTVTHCGMWPGGHRPRPPPQPRTDAPLKATSSAANACTRRSTST